MRWLTGYAETLPSDHGRIQSRRPVYPLLLERLASDGEWEQVDRLDMPVPNLDSYTRGAFWRKAENLLADRHHVHVNREYTVDSRPVVAC
ncbi:hypothetical protein [Bifidobacterium sp. SO1]|uniref:hypothetical protein n=1 Tax=Bifidobacterium sp. SO1 TaxID=2809029 RepID=UPI001BDBF229|nr:hypothetical protein [Bifidobacterium sp. SO1]MBT1161709.1 hypothetical protein [Bifidobacterium sp. SO1]